MPSVTNEALMRDTITFGVILPLRFRREQHHFLHPSCPYILIDSRSSPSLPPRVLSLQNPVENLKTSSASPNSRLDILESNINKVSVNSPPSSPFPTGVSAASYAPLLLRVVHPLLLSLLLCFLRPPLLPGILCLQFPSFLLRVSRRLLFSLLLCVSHLPDHPLLLCVLRLPLADLVTPRTFANRSLTKYSLLQCLRSEVI